MMSLPQIINQITAPMSKNTMIREVQVIILRFFDIGFFCFLDFLVDSVSEGSLAAFNSPLCSSKSKT